MNQDNNTFIPVNPNVDTLNIAGTVQPQGVAQPQVVTQPPVFTQPQVVAQPQGAEQSQGGNQPQAVTQQVEPQATLNPSIYICPKCGSEVRKESRYCMKCGNLNYAHPDNESMKKYAWQSIKQGHFISGANLDDKQKVSISIPKADSISNSHPYRGCVIGNTIIFAILFGLTLFGIRSELTVSVILGILLGYGFLFLEVCALGMIFIKADEPWWGLYIPLYGEFLLFKISLGSGWLVFLTIIPVVGQILKIISSYYLGKKFYKSGLLTVLFPYVMIPVIAFSNDSEYSVLVRTFDDSSQVDSKGRTNSEKEYGKKKFLITLLVIIVVAVILYFAWPYLVPILEKLYKIIMEKVGTIK